MATVTDPFSLPPEEAIKFFEDKDYRIGFDWRDIWEDEHRRSFTVAKAIDEAILRDVREALDQAIKDGIPFEQWRRDLAPILQAKGWWGERELVDPVTGEKKLVQLGSAHRLRVIYETNLRQAHQAGAWERFDRVKDRRPWLRYIARAPGQNRRPEHQQWHDKVFRVDDPIWNTIAPMNGWGCQCRVQQLNDRELRRLGLVPSEPLELEYRNWTNKRTGEVHRVPKGIDPGFAHNPGRTRDVAA